MTICIPKKPFDVLFDIIFTITTSIFYWSWIPISVLIILSALEIFDLPLYPLLSPIVMISFMGFMIGILPDIIKNQTTFKWCDKK